MTKIKYRNSGWEKDKLKRVIKICGLILREYTKAKRELPKEIIAYFLKKNDKRKCYAEIYLKDDSLFFYWKPIKESIDKLKKNKMLPEEMLFDYFIASVFIHELVHYTQIERMLPTNEEEADKQAIESTPAIMQLLDYDKETLIPFFRMLYSHIPDYQNKSYVG